MNVPVRMALGGSLDSNLKTEPTAVSKQGPFIQAMLPRQAYTELPACTVFAIWADPYKGVPRISFQPRGLRFSLSVQLYSH